MKMTIIEKVMHMYVNNVSQIIKANAPLSTKLNTGSVISGKILDLENGKGTLKLYDGTIIPAIFISENDIEKEKQLKFVVQSFDGENFTLKVMDENDDAKNQKSFFSIIRDLNIPFDEGKKIILDLIRFNLPATNDNINLIYKNLSFLDKLQKMDDGEIINFLSQALGMDITEDSKEFQFTKELFQNLKSIDRSFLAFMLENDMPHSLDNIAKAQDFMSNKFFLNSFIDNIKNIMSSVSLEDESSINKYVKLLNESSSASTDNVSKTINLKMAQEKTTTVPTQSERLLINSLADKLTKDFNISKSIISESLEQGFTSIKEDLGLNSSNSSNMFNKLLDDYDILKNPQNFINGSPSEPEKLLINSLTYKLSGNYGKIDKNMILTSFEEVFNLLNDKNTNASATTSTSTAAPTTAIVTESESTASAINPIWINNNFDEDITKTILTNNEKQFMNDLMKNLEKNITSDNPLSDFKEAISIIKDNKDIFSFNSSKVYQSLIEDFDVVNNSAKFTNINTSNTEKLFMNALKNNIEANHGIIDKNIVVKSFEQALGVYNDTIDISSLSTSDLYQKLIASESFVKKPTVLMSGNPSDTEKLLIDALISNINKNAGKDAKNKNIVVASFEEALNVFKENKDIFSLGSSGIYQKLMDHFDMFKQISPNYSLYFFNLYEGSNIFKNNIIIKNKYKGSKHIDINDVKAYITVDTKNLGTIEGNLYKKNNDISIFFNVSENTVNLFKNNSKILKNALKEYGYNFVNISIKAKTENNNLPFMDFFNESILKEVDVKV
jgi:hypothetical protein